MTFLPIVIRELRVASRGKALYRARFWTAVAAVGCCSFLMIAYRDAPNALGGGGRLIFQTLAWMGLAYCAFLARNTADCISEEKREGTLGLLFLTDLRGYDVVLGKLCAKSLNSFYGLIATFPVVSCVLVIGGVTALELFLVALALLNVFFFSHAAGLLVSTVSRGQHSVNRGTAALLAAFFLGIPALAALLRHEKSPATAGMLELFNPAYAFYQANALGTGPIGYWLSLWAVHFSAWIFLAMASLLLPRCWQEKPARMNLRWNARFRQWCFGPPAFRERLRLRLLEINPFLWLVSRNRLGSILVWGFLGLVFCGWSWVVRAHGLKDSLPLFALVIIVNHTMLKFWMVSQACSHLETHRRSGALELLLSCTPLSVEEIVEGHWLALRRFFLAPVLAVLAFDVVLIILGRTPGHDRDYESSFIVFVIGSMIMLLADAFTIGWVGMWRAIAERKPRRAVLQTITRVMMPWLVACLLPLLGFGAALAGFLFVLFLLGVMMDVPLAASAKEKLLTQFRTLAAVVREEQLGLLGELGRMLGK